MPFDNDKKTFLAKADKSKKGSIDDKVKPLIAIINNHPQLYTTSSCSGRVYLWRGSGRKNETEWLKVSHDLITEDFLHTTESGFIWLRVEPFIMHICCADLDTAVTLLEQSHRIYKKSCILSISNKIIVEVRGSEVVEMPLYRDGKLLFSNDLQELVLLINTKLERIFRDLQRFEELIRNCNTKSN